MSDSTRATGSAHAFVTLVNDPKYVEGAKVLVHSLRRTGTKLPLIVLVSDLSERHENALAVLGGDVVRIPRVEVTTKSTPNFPPRSKTFAKINAWALEDFRRCVFIDADVVVLRNLDHLFEYPEFAAVGTSDYFNTGVFVFEPSAITYERLTAAAALISEDESYADDSEQEMLQRVFREDFHPLPGGYNFRPYHPAGRLHRAVHRSSLIQGLLSRWDRNRGIHLIHYIGYPKPWEVLLPDHRRDAGHYTWTASELRKARWTFRIWRKHWKRATDILRRSSDECP